jgi:hypothetical protein
MPARGPEGWDWRRRAAAITALVSALTALAGSAPAYSDCGEELFTRYTTDVRATNSGAYVAYVSDEGYPLEDLLANRPESSATTLLYALPRNSAHRRRFDLDTRGTFTTAPTLFEDSGSVRMLVWREGPSHGETRILGGPAGGSLRTLVAPAGSPGFAPLAVTSGPDGGYTVLVPAAGGHGPAMLQQVNADGSLGASTSIGASVPPERGRLGGFDITRAGDGAIWVAGPGLLGFWAPGSAFVILSSLPRPYELAPGAGGSVWALTAASSGSGSLLVHAGRGGVISKVHLANNKGLEVVGETLPTVALATDTGGTATVAYGTHHGAFLASTNAAGVLGRPRRISRARVLSIEDLDLQPQTDVPFVSVTAVNGAAVYSVARHVGSVRLSGLGRGYESVRPTLAFAPDGRAWVVWTVRRGSLCPFGEEYSRSVWATLGQDGRLGMPHSLGDGSGWEFGPG